MNSLVFLNSTLLWGLGLASIPLIIHFLFRRKFRQIDWAPMRYLKLTIQRNSARAFPLAATDPTAVAANRRDHRHRYRHSGTTHL